MRAATASVGLVSPRSTWLSIGALTPLRTDRSRSDRLIASRSALMRDPTVGSATTDIQLYVIAYARGMLVPGVTMGRPMNLRPLLLLPALLALALPAAANGAINPFNALVCAQPDGGGPADGARYCGRAPTTAGQPSADRSRVFTFDSVPLDAVVAMPPPSQGDGPFPLLVLPHGWGGQKSSFTGDEGGYFGSLKTLANKGYVVLSHTARGFNGSCGQAIERIQIGANCANGFIRLDDYRFEAMDIMFLAGKLVDQGIAKPDIGVGGGSYGGGVSLQLAVLKNRMCDDLYVVGDATKHPCKKLVPWTSPAGTPMSIAAAAPIIPWSDLVYSLAPNGRTLDYTVTNPYVSSDKRGDNATEVGIAKQSFVAGLYATGQLNGYYQPTPANDTTDTKADLNTWFARLNSGEPYDDPVVLEMIDLISRFRSPYHMPLLRGRPGAAVHLQRLDRRPVPARRGAALLQPHPVAVPERADLAALRRPRPPARDQEPRRPRRDPRAHAGAVRPLPQGSAQPGDGPAQPGRGLPDELPERSRRRPARPSRPPTGPRCTRARSASPPRTTPTCRPPGDPREAQVSDPIGGGGDACGTVSDATDPPASATYRLPKVDRPGLHAAGLPDRRREVRGPVGDLRPGGRAPLGRRPGRQRGPGRQGPLPARRRGHRGVPAARQRLEVRRRPHAAAAAAGLRQPLRADEQRPVGRHGLRPAAAPARRRDRRLHAGPRAGQPGPARGGYRAQPDARSRRQGRRQRDVLGTRDDVDRRRRRQGHAGRPAARSEGQRHRRVRRVGLSAEGPDPLRRPAPPRPRQRAPPGHHRPGDLLGRLPRQRRAALRPQAHRARRTSGPPARARSGSRCALRAKGVRLLRSRRIAPIRYTSSSATPPAAGGQAHRALLRADPQALITPGPRLRGMSLVRPDVLVLAAGGVVGEAWMTGWLRGVSESCGIDFREVEVFVGTSAGSIVSASLAAGREPRAADARKVAAGSSARTEAPASAPAARALAGAVARGLGTLSAPLAGPALVAGAPGGALARRAILQRVPEGRASLAALRREVDGWGVRFDGRLRVCTVDVASGPARRVRRPRRARGLGRPRPSRRPARCPACSGP